MERKEWEKQERTDGGRDLSGGREGGQKGRREVRKNWEEERHDRWMEGVKRNGKRDGRKGWMGR